MHKPAHRRHKHSGSLRRGFTLVELALTALVIGLGLLTVFGMGRLGLQSAAEAENDARCALLANDILATLRTASDDACRTGGPPAFAAFWRTLRNDAGARVEFPAAGSPALANTMLDELNNPLDGIRGGGVPSYVRFASPTALAPTPVDEWSARFWIHVDLETTLGAGTNEANLARLSLNIQPDVFSTRADTRTFYTHISARTLWP